MFKFLKKDRICPYFIGMLMGLLILVLLNFGRHLGTCCGITKLTALVSYFFAPEFTLQSSYLNRQISDHLIFNSKLLLLIGLFIGAKIACLITKDAPKLTQTIWTERFGKSARLRHISVFFGSILLILGARIAGGCVAGHGLMGISQQSITSIAFLIFVTVSAIPSAFILYHFTKRS
jgi:hypothetical protein